jgi:hypothetical protein
MTTGIPGIVIARGLPAGMEKSKAEVRPLITGD